jgi:hypothetical protein
MQTFINIGHHGLANKQVYIVDSGHVMMIKPFQRASPWPQSIYKTIPWFSYVVIANHYRIA